MLIDDRWIRVDSVIYVFGEFDDVVRFNYLDGGNKKWLGCAMPNKEVNLTEPKWFRGLTES